MRNKNEHNNPKAYQKAARRAFEQRLYMPKLGTKIVNILESSVSIVSEETPYVIIGQKGEEYCVSKEVLLNSYQLTEEDVDAFAVGMEPATIKTKSGLVFWVKQTNIYEHIKIVGEHGEIMTSNLQKDRTTADWIICADDNGKPNMKDRWILNGDIFEQTMILS